MINRRTKTSAMAMAVAMAMALATVNMPSMGNPVKVLAEEQKGEDSDISILQEWNFDDGIDGWEHAGWDYQYNGERVTTEAENGKLKVNVDFSKDGANSWSQTGVRKWGNISIQNANKLAFDFYYDPEKLTQGGFGIKTVVQYQDGEQYPSAVETDMEISTEEAEDAENGLKKVPVLITFDPVRQEECCNVVLCIIGKNTTYSGAVYVDHLRFIKAGKVEDTSIDATVTADRDKKKVSYQNGSLGTYNKENQKQETGISKTITMVDPKADAAAKAAYAYLEAVGKSDSVIYGHQNDTSHKAGAAELSCSDTYDVTGDYAGVMGLDSLSLTGNEYSAAKYNETLGKDKTEKLPETPAGNVKAAAALSNWNIEQGALMTLSAHMPNFSIVKENSSYKEGDPSYAKYDFTGYSPNDVSGDVVNNILPGGKYHEVYNAFLDMIADYASQVNGAILFRPFHENTGSWFWWGAAFCDEETYKNIYRYTVEYLRDEKNIHNLIYVYGPGSEAATIKEYEARYPGDAYVDMVGFDMYNSDPGEDNRAWYDGFQKELDLVCQFAREHNKLAAVTETGVATSQADKGDSQTALHITGNQQKNWYQNVLEMVSKSDASYYLLWANFSKKDGFYTPFVDSVNDGILHGHEMLDPFINFYNDPRTIFAGGQKEGLSELGKTNQVQAEEQAEVTGYITEPVARSRVLKPIAVKARVGNIKAGDSVIFSFHGDKDMVKEVKADVEGNTASVLLDQDTLNALGEFVGTIDLKVNGTVLQSIGVMFNIPEPEEDPYLIDDFENYYGVDTLMTQKWAVNKETGCTISLTLTKDKEKRNQGEYGLCFDYKETKTGWAGATISKPVDWSNCNALQFYTIPDGLKQKYVIQITAGGFEYEVHLNDYKEYTDTKEPMLVAIPFSAFKDRDGDAVGTLQDNSASIQSFGLWVNAIETAPVFENADMVEGTLYYDTITAVTSQETEPIFKKASEIKDPDKEPDQDPDKKPDQEPDKEPDQEPDKEPDKNPVAPVPSVPVQTPGDLPSSSGGTQTEPEKNPSDQTEDEDKTENPNNPGDTDNPGQQPIDQPQIKPDKDQDTDQDAVVKPEKGDIIKNTEKQAKCKINNVTKKTVIYTGTLAKKKKNLIIPASIKTDDKTKWKVIAVGKNAMKGNTIVTKITLSSGIEEIRSGAFSGCNKLKEIVIPASVSKFGTNAFRDCKNLKSIIIKNKNLAAKNIKKKAFAEISEKTKIYVPEGKVKSYRSLLRKKGLSKKVNVLKREK